MIPVKFDYLAPTSVEEAVVALDADDALTAALGAELVATVADVRRGEVARFDGATDEAVVDALL